MYVVGRVCTSRNLLMRPAAPKRQDTLSPMWYGSWMLGGKKWTKTFASTTYFWYFAHMHIQTIHHSPQQMYILYVSALPSTEISPTDHRGTEDYQCVCTVNVPTSHRVKPDHDRDCTNNMIRLIRLFLESSAARSIQLAADKDVLVKICRRKSATHV